MTNDEEKLINALENYFGREKKFIDTSRIPLICQDISNIHRDLNEIKDNITWIVRLIIGAVLLALIALVLK